IHHRHAIAGYNFSAVYCSDQSTYIIKLKSFEDRSGGITARIKRAITDKDPMALIVNPYEQNSVLGMIYKQTAAIKDAQILAFGPPMISGFSVQNSVTMTMQDKTGGDLNKFYNITKSFLNELNKRPEIQQAITSYNPNYPQYMVDVDVAKTKQAGISPSAVLSVMQGYYGGLYASNFNAYGKLYRVMIQGDVESRMRPDGLSRIYVRTSSGEMSPVSEFVKLRKVYGPSNIGRFNLFTSIDVSVSPNTGYSNGQVMQAIKEVSADMLPQGYGYEYSGLTRSEAESSNSTSLIFVLCFIFVYLILSAQYESYILPLAVLLSIPFGLAGAFIFTNIFGHSNDIYMQISLIMLIGLLAKNAILIVQFALERRETGMAIKYSAILGAAARLRPILMTSLAMVIGLLPLMFASGVGKSGNQTLGAAAVGGMFLGTLIQVFVVPALFCIFQYLQEKVKPMKFEDESNKEVEAELSQYARSGAAVESEMDAKGDRSLPTGWHDQFLDKKD
uniref:efflux RND transporter permease subunit n=1 Tax=Prevotella sp. TaxID=59823 RepID=UPI004024DD60